MDSHPTDPMLNAYGLGKLDGASALSVDRHLKNCPGCRERVAGMSSDSFLDRVRGAQKETGKSISVGLPIDGAISFVQPNAVLAPPRAETLPPGLADNPDYEIKRELGRGGMGVVYLAHNALMGRDEVLKVMSKHLMERPGVLERFLREIRAVAKLRHPNIVTAYSATRLGDSIVFSMEYVEGLDLSKMVKAKGPLPVAHACNFAYQAALGLQHAHEKGLIHRDIKPHNLMLSRKGDKAAVKVLDFGLAKVACEEKVDGGLTSQGQALGTPDYIAPEQILDAQSADIRADIYSLGGTLYFLLTGRPPFKANSLYDIYQAHISRNADPLNLVRPEVPSELAALVAKMMAKEPKRRFQTPGEVAQALTPFFKRVSVPPAPSHEPASIGAPKKQHPHVDLPRPGKGASDAPMAQADPPEPLNPIDMERDESRPDPRPLVSRRRTDRRPVRVLPGVLIAGVLGVVLLGVFRIKTSEGTVQLKGLPRGANVYVDGDRIRVEFPGDGSFAVITVPTGKHVVRVEKEGFVASGKEVALVAGGRTLIDVSLSPLETPRAGGVVENEVLPAEVNPWPEALRLGGETFFQKSALMAVSLDGRRVAQKTGNQTLQIFTAPDNRRPVDGPVHDPWIFHATFSPDGSQLASCADDTSVRIWDTDTGKLIRRIEHGARVVSASYSRDGKRIASVGHNGPMSPQAIKVWEVGTGELKRNLRDVGAWPWCAAFSPDGKQLASGGGPWEETGSAGELKVFDIATGAGVKLGNYSMRVSSLDFSPDGRYLSTASFDGTARVWDLELGRLVTSFDKHKGYLTGVRFSHDGRLVCSSARNDSVRVWEAATGREVASLGGLMGAPRTLEVSAGGRWVYSGSGNTLNCWEVPASAAEASSDRRAVVNATKPSLINPDRPAPDKGVPVALPLKNGGVLVCGSESKSWYVDHESLYYRRDPVKNHGIYTEKTYKDYEFRFQVKTIGAGHAIGIVLHSLAGEVQSVFSIRPDGSGQIEVDGHKLVNLEKSMFSNVNRPGDWNTYAVRCVGHRILVRLNGTKIIDREFPEVPTQGGIGFWAGWGQMIVKDFELDEIGG